MRGTWPILAGIAVIGGVAGAVIAGQSEGVETFVIAPAVVESAPATVSTTPETVGTTVPAPVDTPSATSVPTPSVAVTTTIPAATTSTAVATTEVPVTAATAAPTTVPPPTPKADVRLVLANGDGRYNLVTANADRLRAAGWVQIVGDDTERVLTTVIYYRSGFDEEAALVAADLLVPGALLEPLPDTPVTGADEAGDIVVVLGPDATR